MTNQVKLTKNTGSIANIIIKNQSLTTKEEQLLIDKLENGTTAEKLLLQTLHDYHDVMKDVNVDENIGIKQQMLLFNALLKVLNTEDSKEFRTLWSIVLLFAKLNASTSFNSTMVNRFTYLWNTGEDKMRAFLNINNVILLTRDEATRKRNVKFQIDFDKAFSVYFKPDVGQKLINFYNT